MDVFRILYKTIIGLLSARTGPQLPPDNSSEDQIEYDCYQCKSRLYDLISQAPRPAVKLGADALIVAYEKDVSLLKLRISKRDEASRLLEHAVKQMSSEMDELRHMIGLKEDQVKAERAMITALGQENESLRMLNERLHARLQELNK